MAGYDIPTADDASQIASHPCSYALILSHVSSRLNKRLQSRLHYNGTNCKTQTHNCRG